MQGDSKIESFRPEREPERITRNDIVPGSFRKTGFQVNAENSRAERAAHIESLVAVPAANNQSDSVLEISELGTQLLAAVRDHGGYRDQVVAHEAFRSRVTPSAARNLALKIMGLRDSSSPSAPRND